MNLSRLVFLPIFLISLVWFLLLFSLPAKAECVCTASQAQRDLFFYNGAYFIGGLQNDSGDGTSCHLISRAYSDPNFGKWVGSCPSSPPDPLPQPAPQPNPQLLCSGNQNSLLKSSDLELSGDDYVCVSAMSLTIAQSIPDDIQPKQFEEMNIVDCAVDKFRNVFPFDLFDGTLGYAGSCPKVEFFGEAFEFCWLMDVFSLIEIPSMILLIIWVFLSI